MNVTIHTTSLLEAKCDTIVNAANSFLRHGGGLAAAIAKAATGPIGGDPSESLAGSVHGPQDIPWTKKGADWQQEQFAHPNIATGDAGWTSAGHLPFKGIVHAVGPIWKDGSLMEPYLLRMAYLNAMRVALHHGCKSIAFPALSAGIFGAPIEDVAMAAKVVSHASMTARSFDRIQFYLTDPKHVEAFAAEGLR